MTEGGNAEDGLSEGRSELYSVDHDGRSGPLSVTIVTAVAAATGTDPTELPPLGRSIGIDFDMLDDLFLPESAASRSADTYLRFTYEGCEVIVRADGRVVIYEAE